MNSIEFQSAIKSLIIRVERNLLSKAAEYATDYDRLHNFNKGARMQDKPREDVLWGIALKQEISILDMIDDLKNGKIPTQEMLDEKLGDYTTYMALLYACFQDRINVNNSQLLVHEISESIKDESEQG